MKVEALNKARFGVYPYSSLKELPAEMAIPVFFRLPVTAKTFAVFRELEMWRTLAQTFSPP